MEATQAAKSVPITERLRNIKIGSYTVDHGSHTKHIAVRAICEEAATEIERLRKLDIELRGECVLLADVLRDAFEVVKTIDGENSDESDKLTGLCLSIAHALALYDDERIKAANRTRSPALRPRTGNRVMTLDLLTDAETKPDGAASAWTAGLGCMPPVLDACCGSRMFWFDKTDARALFLDKRREVCEDPRGREIVIDPDTLGDFTALPFDDETFSLVVFDPPHTFSGAESVMAKKYGTLKAGWRDEIRAGFAECFRVLKPAGVLVFKWNEHRVPVATVLSLTPEKPLFGQRAGAQAKTHWLVFMKPNAKVSGGGAFPPSA